MYNCKYPKTMAIRIGITGGIGCGKSIVSRLLGLLDIPTYISDNESKRLVATDPEIRTQLTRLVGKDICPDGVLDRQLLASYLFASDEHTRRVNAIVHPRVRDDFRHWTALQSVRHSIVAIESAILIEAGFASEVDKIVMVYAPLETRIARAARRDSASRQQIEARIHQQADDEAKRQQADFVLLNDDSTPLIPQVLHMLASLTTSTCP